MLLEERESGMNTIHHLESGLERETTALAWHCVPATVDLPVTTTHALSAASVSRLWREPLATRPNAPHAPNLKKHAMERETESRPRAAARRLVWDNWDKLSEL